LRDALAQCDAEDLLGRIACDYRARASYCDGHWGAVALCPGGTVNDHGQ
jgi:hypothetical protein